MHPDAAPGRFAAEPRNALENPTCLSIVVPAHDEAQVLPSLWARIEPVLHLLESRGVRAELVLVNDGSTDDTLAVMRSLAARSGRIRVIDLARRFGHQPALVAGLAHARGRAIAVLDADLQDPPELIPELVERWRSGHDIVYGVRRARQGDGWFKRASARAFYAFLGIFAGDAVRPDVGDFYLMDRKVAEAVVAGHAGRPFLRGALVLAGFRHTGVPYDRTGRLAGRTKYPLRRMLSLGLDAITSLSFAPLRIASILGVLGIVAGAVALPLTGGGVPALVVLASGVQLLSVGIVGEYVGRIHEVVIGRPLYLVREVIEPEHAARVDSDEAAS